MSPIGPVGWGAPRVRDIYVPPPPPEEGGTWSLLGNPSFNPSSPTLKGGTSIPSGDIRDLYNGLLWFAANPANQFDSNTDSRLTQGDTYHLGRIVRSRFQAFSIALRLTGDLRMLDVMTQWLKLSKQSLAIGYRGHNTSVVNWSPSPYPCWVVRGGSQPDNLYGTDHSVMNEVKWHATVAEITYALWLNRNYTSPAGHNYLTEYNYWYNYLVNQYTPKWSGGGTDDWRINYRGVRRPPTWSTSGGNPNATQRYGRNALAVHPLAVNGGELHSAVSQSHFAYYMGKLTANESATAEFNWTTDNFINVSSDLVSSPSMGIVRVWGHGQMGDGGSLSTTAQGMTYVGYTIADMTSMYLEGGSPQINFTMLRQMANAFASFMLLPLSQDNLNGSSFLLHVDTVGGVPRGKFTTSYTSYRSQAQYCLYPFSLIAPFETGTVHMEEVFRQLNKAGSWQGTMLQPKNPFLAASVLTAFALAGSV